MSHGLGASLRDRATHASTEPASRLGHSVSVPSADFTIADVLAWARTKPADEAYNFVAAKQCAVAQFGRETGREYLVGIGDIQAYSVELWSAVINHGRSGDQSFADAGWTFGQLVKRLEKLCPDVPVPSEWTKLDTYLTDIETVSA